MTNNATPVPAASTSGVVRAGILRSFTAFLGRYPNLAIKRIIERAGLDPRLFGNPNAVVDARRNAAMLDLFAETSNDAALAVQYAHHVTWGDLGPVAYIVMNSPTVGVAIANACRYFRLQGTGGGTTLEIDRGEAQLSYVMFDPAIVSHAQNTEWVFGLIVRALREAMGDAGWSPRAIRFRHEKPRRTSVQREVLRCPLAWGQSQDAIILTPADLRMPLLRADAGLLGILVEHANDKLSATIVSDPFEDQVKRVVMASLRSGEVSIKHIAQKLGTSTRTIQRRLEESDRSFRGVIEQTRLALSKRYLEDLSMSLTEAAYLLGYSDLSAFSRAFRRWTGLSALEFRRQHATKPLA